MTVITRELVRPDSMTVAFHEWNAEAGTPPVVLQHGYVASTETNWVVTGVLDALLAAGHRVVGVDARGHGRSGTSPDRALYGEPTMAADDMAEVGRVGGGGKPMFGEAKRKQIKADHMTE